MKQKILNLTKLIIFSIVPLTGFYMAKRYYQWTNISNQIYFIEGCKYFNPEEVKAVMEKAKAENEHLSLPIIQKYILTLPWVKDCNVRYHLTSNKKLYKHNTIWIHLEEKKPLAKTFDSEFGNALLLEDGSVIQNHQTLFMSKLVKVNVINLGEEILFFVRKLYQYPEIKALIDSCYYVRPGRWNLLMEDKLIKLQEDFSFVLEDFNNADKDDEENNDKTLNANKDNEDKSNKHKINEDKVNKVQIIPLPSLDTLQAFMKNHPEEYKQASKIDFRKIGYAIVEEQKQSVNDLIKNVIG